MSTLRQRGYTSCEHPSRLVEADRPAAVLDRLTVTLRSFCEHCGAELREGKWHGGSLDFSPEEAFTRWGSLAAWFDQDGGAR